MYRTVLSTEVADFFWVDPSYFWRTHYFGPRGYDMSRFFRKKVWWCGGYFTRGGVQKEEEEEGGNLI